MVIVDKAWAGAASTRVPRMSAAAHAATRRSAHREPFLAIGMLPLFPSSQARQHLDAHGIAARRERT